MDRRYFNALLGAGVLFPTFNWPQTAIASPLVPALEVLSGFIGRMLGQRAALHVYRSVPTRHATRAVQSRTNDLLARTGGGANRAISYSQRRHEEMVKFFGGEVGDYIGRELFKYTYDLHREYKNSIERELSNGVEVVRIGQPNNVEGFGIVAGNHSGVPPIIPVAIMRILSNVDISIRERGIAVPAGLLPGLTLPIENKSHNILSTSQWLWRQPTSFRTAYGSIEVTISEQGRGGAFWADILIRDQVFENITGGPMSVYLKGIPL